MQTALVRHRAPTGLRSHTNPLLEHDIRRAQEGSGQSLGPMGRVYSLRPAVAGEVGGQALTASLTCSPAVSRDRPSWRVLTDGEMGDGLIQADRTVVHPMLFSVHPGRITLARPMPGGEGRVKLGDLELTFCQGAGWSMDKCFSMSDTEWAVVVARLAHAPTALLAPMPRQACWTNLWRACTQGGNLHGVFVSDLYPTFMVDGYPAALLPIWFLYTFAWMTGASLMRSSTRHYGGGKWKEVETRLFGGGLLLGWRRSSEALTSEVERALQDNGLLPATAHVEAVGPVSLSTERIGALTCIVMEGISVPMDPRWVRGVVGPTDMYWRKVPQHQVGKQGATVRLLAHAHYLRDYRLPVPINHEVEGIVGLEEWPMRPHEVEVLKQEVVLMSGPWMDLFHEGIERRMRVIHAMLAPLMTQLGHLVAGAASVPHYLAGDHGLVWWLYDEQSFGCFENVEAWLQDTPTGAALKESFHAEVTRAYSGLQGAIGGSFTLLNPAWQSRNYNAGSGELQKMGQWLEELRRLGVRGRKGRRIEDMERMIGEVGWLCVVGLKAIVVPRWAGAPSGGRSMLCAAEHAPRTLIQLFDQPSGGGRTERFWDSVKESLLRDWNGRDWLANMEAIGGGSDFGWSAIFLRMCSAEQRKLVADEVGILVPGGSGSVKVRLPHGSISDLNVSKRTELIDRGVYGAWIQASKFGQIAAAVFGRPRANGAWRRRRVQLLQLALMTLGHECRGHGCELYHTPEFGAEAVAGVCKLIMLAAGDSCELRNEYGNTNGARSLVQQVALIAIDHEVDQEARTHVRQLVHASRQQCAPLNCHPLDVRVSTARRKHGSRGIHHTANQPGLPQIGVDGMGGNAYAMTGGEQQAIEVIVGNEAWVLDPRAIMPLKPHYLVQEVES